MDDESSDRHSLLAVLLPALLSSLAGGVCSLVMFGGRIERVSVTLGLSLLCVVVLDRSFIFPREWKWRRWQSWTLTSLECTGFSWELGCCQNVVSIIEQVV